MVKTMQSHYFNNGRNRLNIGINYATYSKINDT